MYKLKQIEEDFLVKEKSNVKLKDKGKAVLFRMRKKGLTTYQAVEIIAGKLGINSENIGFAGSKDKKAITEQMISILGVQKERVERLNFENIHLEFVGYADERLCLGDLEGNEFEIVARNLENNEKIRKIKQVPNYFDEQRFSVKNPEIGKAIIKKQFENAVKMIDETSENRIKVMIENYLSKKPKDFIGAIKLVPRRILMIYIHSYQSLLFNLIVDEYMKKNPKKNVEIPLIGFGSEIEGELKPIADAIMKKECVSSRDFIIKELPNLSAEGDSRNLFAEIHELKVGKMENDELNSEKKKCRISFWLDKGCYATNVVKYLLKG